MITVDNQVITIEREISAPPAEVYREFTLPTNMRDWLCDEAMVDATPGGIIFLKWWDGNAVLGEFELLEQDQRLRFNWRQKRDQYFSSVEVKLYGGSQKTMVEISHRGDFTGHDREYQQRKVVDFWKTGLENLQSVLEQGMDLRRFRRPIIGIIVDNVNENIASQYGAPISDGILISALSKGTDAQKAGLKIGDILVDLDGETLHNICDIGPLLDNKKAGDKICLGYYRGNEKQTTCVVLSQRSIPDHPLTACELSEQINQQFDEINQALTATLENTSENQVQSQPGSPEWVAKSSLAKMIITERNLLTWISDLLNNQISCCMKVYEPISMERISAVVLVYPTLLVLMEEFLRCQAETEALLAFLPDEVVQRKFTFYQIAEAVADILEDFKGHLMKIQEVVPR